MCGICGWVDPGGGTAGEPVRAMLGRLAHRGPDGEGLWSDPSGRAVLGHRRLRVLDPTPRADQPMAHDSGPVLVYNGETFNFVELRRELEGEGAAFATTGDTEVVLEALVRWGTGALERLEGQAALALWDPRQGRLLLARDRLGIKPLFWARVGEGVAFASELPALLAHPGVARDLDREALARWLQLGFLCGRETLVPGVERLEPGHLLELGPGGVSVRRWYDPLDGAARRETPGEREVIRRLLWEEVGRAAEARLVADVPLGCFLSGGVDSALVAAAVAAAGRAPEALTIAFEAPYDETAVAAATAGALGLEHHVAACGSGEMLAVLDRWEEVAGDPLADPSLAPTWLVSREARRRWTVALSGDGGDELLSGYPRLRFMPRLEAGWRIPGFRRALAGLPLPARRWSAKLGPALEAPDPWRAYQCLQGVWPGAEVAALLGVPGVPLPWPEELLGRLEDLDPWTRYRALDLLTFLPERVLAKVDRASMDHALEVRVPLLDHRVVELLLSVPPQLARDKALIRGVLAERTPVPVPPRRKRGFEVPLAAWLRGPLRGTVREHVLGTTVRELGLDTSMLERAWEAHQSGSADLGERLFAVAVLSRWVDRWLR